MSELPFQKIFWADFFTKTQCLSGFARGMYALLIGHLWLAGGAIADNDRKVAEMVNIHLATYRRLKLTLAPFLQLGDGWIRQKRVSEDLLRAHESDRNAQDRTRNARKALAKKRKNKDLAEKAVSVTDPKTLYSHSQSVNSGLKPESLHAATDRGSPGLGGRSPGLAESQNGASQRPSA